MNASSRRLTLALVLFLLGLILTALVTAWLTDGPTFLAVLGSLKPAPIFGALFCMTASYVAIALSFAALLQVSHYRVGFPRLFSITLISTTFNYVVSTAGVSSLAVRAYLFKRQRVPLSLIVPLSIAQSMMTNLVLTLMCLGGLWFLRTQPGFKGGAGHLFILGALGILVTLVVITAVGYFHAPTRHRAIRAGVGMTAWIRQRVLRRPFATGRPGEVARNLEESTRLLHRGWAPLLVALFWVTMDWVFTVLTMQQCFMAVEIPLSAGLVLVGFTLAFLSSTVNIFPGGLGVMEGLLTVTYSHFGVPQEKAMVAALLFRMIYFLLPLAVSAALYLDTLKALLKNDPSKNQ